MADNFDFKQYTKLRDIAQKRIKRMQKSGMTIDVHIPTVKELRAGTDEYRKRMGTVLSEFVVKGPSLTKKRIKERELLSPEVQIRRTKEREKRRLKVAKQMERPSYPQKYQSYLKGIKKLGVDISPSKLPAFFDYMDYRLAQGSASRSYVFDIFVEDFQKLLEHGYNPEQIISDFEQFLANHAMVAERMGNMKGMSKEQAIVLWDKFIVKSILQ